MPQSLRRFMRNDVQHPTYTALLELGKVQRTLFAISSAQRNSDARYQEGQSARGELELGN